MSRTKIGFFDSGIGGISVLSHARRRLPGADYLYYADTDHVPYGTKSRGEIIRYSDEAVGFLAEQGADAVVVACNTATSMAIGYLREKYPFPIVGMEPAVKPAAAAHQGEKILVCATPVTIAGEKLHTLIEHNYASDDLPDLIGLPGLVTFAEQEIFDRGDVCKYLASVIDKERNYSAVVLGCTHFGYFSDSFRELLGDIDLIDGTKGTVNRLISVLESEHIPLPADEEGCMTFYQTGRPVTDPKTLAFFDRLLARAEKFQN
ncbi:MAG: glutamate racemase [Clostridia bacterium]|nr:glutamate racemase [Clostridia bacterium]